MTKRQSLRELAGMATSAQSQSGPGSTEEALQPTPAAREAQTRVGSRQVAGHFKAEVAQALRVLAAEQDVEQQALLAEALNMLFERYGKSTRAAVLGSRRKRTA